MLRIPFGLVASVISLCAVLGCSAGSTPGSETNQRPGGGSGNTPGNGSGSGSSVGSGKAGAPSIDTNSGEVMDAGDCGSTLDVLYRDFDESHGRLPR
jgi:hypothetical protein